MAPAEVVTAVLNLRDYAGAILLGLAPRAQFAHSRRMSTARFAIFACALLAAGGCYYSGRPAEPPEPEPAPIGLHSPVRIWTGDSVETWHAVRLTPDSVSGVPYRMSVKCDSCRRSMSLARVDSMKVRSPSTMVRGAEFVGGVAAFLAIDAAVCRVVAPHDKQC